MTGIPLSRVAESETEQLLNMEKELKLKVKGQDTALKSSLMLFLERELV